jgi:hypothetical protein
MRLARIRRGFYPLTASLATQISGNRQHSGDPAGPFVFSRPLPHNAKHDLALELNELLAEQSISARGTYTRADTFNDWHWL